MRIKRMLAVAGATFALTAGALIAPTVDLTHDHKDNAPATAAAHDMAENCTHTYKRELWYTAIFIAHFNSSTGRHYHYYEHSNNAFPWIKHYVYTDCTWAG